MADFKRLSVWKRAHAMAIETHKVASRLHGSAHISLRNRMVRAAMSVPANIVEGREQPSEREFARFLSYSISSLSELEYHLLIGHDLRAIGDTDFRNLVSEVKIIRAMYHSLRKKLLPPAAGSSKAGSG